MSDGSIQVPPDSTGSRLRTEPEPTALPATGAPIDVHVQVVRLSEEDRSLLEDLLTTQKRMLAAIVFLGEQLTQGELTIDEIDEVASKF